MRTLFQTGGISILMDDRGCPYIAIDAEGHRVCKTPDEWLDAVCYRSSTQGALSAQQIAYIRASLENRPKGTLVKEEVFRLSKLFGVSIRTIYRIKSRTTYKSL